MSRCLDTTSTMNPGEFIDAVVEIFNDNVDGFPGLLKLIQEMNDRDEEAYDKYQEKKQRIAELTADKANLGLVIDIVKDENEVNKKNMFKAQAQLQECERELCVAREELDQADEMGTELSETTKILALENKILQKQLDDLWKHHAEVKELLDERTLIDKEKRKIFDECFGDMTD